jgi:Zn-dependent protease with chaperone function
MTTVWRRVLSGHAVVLALAAFPRPIMLLAQAGGSTATAPTAASTPTAPAPGQASPTRDTTAPVPVPAPSEKAQRYYRSGKLLGWVNLLWGLLLPAALLFSGWSARLRDVAWRWGRRWYFALAIYGALVSLLFWVVNLPLAWYAGYQREHAYGLSTESLGKWFGDSAKEMGIGIIGFALVMWVPYLLLRKSPRRWWLWTALAGIPLIAATLWVTPLVVDPLFNHFGPMRDHALETRILAQAERAGIERSRVFEVDKSSETRALNAYVTGFGSSGRIVLWDTTVDRMSEPELMFVLGHEMGHYVLHHTQLLMAASCLLLLFFLYSVHRASGWLIRRHQGRFGFGRLDDFASYPLLLLVIGVVSLLALPPFLALSRHLEHEADRFGLELTRTNRAAATAFVKLQTDNLDVPYHGTLSKLIRDSHPDLGERIEFANHYRPWAGGQPLRYGDRFHQPE